jgi:hypothetical protein
VDPLPAPGMSMSTYPKGFRPEQLFLEIPYEELPERCIYGQLHRQVDGLCRHCSGMAYAPEYTSQQYPPGLFNKLSVAPLSHRFVTEPQPCVAYVAQKAPPIW